MCARILTIIAILIVGMPTCIAAQDGGSDAIAVAGPSRSTLYALQQAIGLAIKPHWLGKAPRAEGAEKLVTILRFNLNRDGTLAADPEIVGQEGVTDANRPQARDHAEQAMLAVRRAAPFRLPVQYFQFWRKVTFRFDQLPQKDRGERPAAQSVQITYAVDTDGRLSGCQIVKRDFHDDDVKCNPQMVGVMAARMLPQPLARYQSISVTLAMGPERSDDIIPRRNNEDGVIITRSVADISPDGRVTSCRTEISREWLGKPANICGSTIALNEKAFAADPQSQNRNLVVVMEISGLRRQ